MALPLLERYSLNQAINFIKNRTGEQLTREDLLEYAITGHLKIGIYIKVFNSRLMTIGNQDCKNMRLCHFESPILHTTDYPIWANPKSHLHKQMCWFNDGYVDIHIDLPFTEQTNNYLSIKDHIEKLSCEDESQVIAYVKDLQSKNFEEIKKEVKLETKISEDKRYEKISWAKYGELSFKGFSYLDHYTLNKLKPIIQKNESLLNYDFEKFVFESVDFTNSKIKSFLSFDMDLDVFDYLPDDEYEQATLNTISIDDLIIFKDDLLKFIGESEKDLNFDNALYLLGEVLSAVKSKNRKWTQSTIINEILQQRQNKNKTIQGLEQRKIEDYFSQANKKLKSE
ncbi:hypothetical protein A1D25_04235 [Ursidibacter arcticus]|nr:hypothetical protein A1D25_04235 [Ursidibacter arcticus]